MKSAEKESAGRQPILTLGLAWGDTIGAAASTVNAATVSHSVIVRIRVMEASSIYRRASAGGAPAPRRLAARTTAARSAWGLDEARDLPGLGNAPGLALGEHGTTVDGDRQLAQTAPANLRRHVKGRLELVAEADRLAPQVHSDRAAFD